MEAFIAQTARAQQVPQVTLAWQGGEPTLMGLDFFRRARAAEAGRVPAGMARRAHPPDQRHAARRRVVRVPRRERLPGRAQPRRPARAARRLPAGQGRAAGLRPGRRGRPPPAEARRRVQRPLHGQRRQRRPPARGLPLLPRRARRPLHPVHPDRRGRDAARRTSSARAACHRAAACSRSGLRPLPDRRSSTSGCAATWARCSCRSSTACSPPTCAATSSLCIFQPTCGEGAALEHNGDLYSCDHFVEPQHLLGNITETPIGDLVRSEQQRAFGRAKPETLPALLPLLRVPLRLQRRVPEEPHPADARRRARPQLALRRAQGVLRPHGAPDAPDGRPAARGAARRAEVMAILAEEARTTGRNDPCPCGSGKKYKRCCGIVAG